jgi:hypothetical protein
LPGADTDRAPGEECGPLHRFLEASAAPCDSLAGEATEGDETAPPASAANLALSAFFDHSLGCWFGADLRDVDEEDALAAACENGCRGDLNGCHAVLCIPASADAPVHCTPAARCPAGSDAAAESGGTVPAACLAAAVAAADGATPHRASPGCMHAERLRGLPACDGGMGSVPAAMLKHCVALGSAPSTEGVVVPATAAHRFELRTRCTVTAVDFTGACNSRDSSCGRGGCSSSDCSSGAPAECGALRTCSQGRVRVAYETRVKEAVSSPADDGSAVEFPSAISSPSPPPLLHDISARFVIVALPLGVLQQSCGDKAASEHGDPSGAVSRKTDAALDATEKAATPAGLAFHPPLPPPLSRALRSLRMGQYKKVHLLFARDPLPLCTTPFVALLGGIGSQRVATSGTSSGACAGGDAEHRAGGSAAADSALPAAGPEFRIVEHSVRIKGPDYPYLSGILYGNGVFRPSKPAAASGVAKTAATSATAGGMPAASATLDLWDDAACVAALVQQLSRHMEAAGWPPLPPVVSSYVTHWESEPLTGCGAYSYLPKTAAAAVAPTADAGAAECAPTPPVDVERLQCDLNSFLPTGTDVASAAKPCASGSGGGVLFAGECFHAEYMGSLHGAVLSGEAAARRVLRRIQAPAGGAARRAAAEVVGART